MPRTANTTDALLADLSNRLARLAETARKEGREEALADVRSLVSGEATKRRKPTPRKPKAARKAAKPRTKSKKPRKSSWAGLTPEQWLARVNAIRKGRGLPPRAATEEGTVARSESGFGGVTLTNDAN